MTTKTERDIYNDTDASLLRGVVLDALYYLDPGQHDAHVWSWLDSLCWNYGMDGYCHIIENMRRDAAKRHTRSL